MDNSNFFDKLVSIFTSVFANIETEMFKYFSQIFLAEIISGFLILIIIFYFTRKIKEGQFEIPKDIYDIIAFLIMVIFVNYCLNNQSFMTKIVNYLQIPANILSDFVKDSRAFNLSGNTIGQILNDMVIDIADRAYIFTGSDGISLFKLSIKSVVGFLLWLVYAWFGVILIASITMTFILTLMQIQFWKCFAVIMIPLIYFKVTRGMTIFWLKNIIALSLISSFMIIIGHLSSSVEYSLIETIPNTKEEVNQSYGLLIAFIIAKIITITFLKEIPAMINGMLGTSAGGSTGAFANSVAMGSIGAAAAGAGFAAFKGAMRGGKVASGIAKTAGTSGKNMLMKEAGAANKLLDKNGGSGGASSGGSGGTTNIGGNVSKKTANVSTGSSNSNTSSNSGESGSKETKFDSFKRGASNIWNGRAAQHREPPKE